MKTVMKSKAASIFTAVAAAVITAGLIQPAIVQPVRAEEGAAVSYVDMYGAMLDELAPISVGTFSDDPDYKKYGLYDMNGDGIKELIVYHEGDYEDTIGYYVYTWDGTQVVQCQEKILRGGQLRGSGTSVLELHPAPKAWSKIVMKWDLVGNTLQGDIYSKSSMDDESFPDSFPDWANAVPIEFSADLYDRSILEKESGGVTDAQPADVAAADQTADPAAEAANISAEATDQTADTAAEAADQNGGAAGQAAETVEAPTGIQASEELDQMQNMCYRLFAHTVMFEATPGFHADLTSMSAEDKAFLAYYYQYHFAGQDDRVQQNTEINIVTKQAFSEIMTELFGTADEASLNALYTSYGVKGIDGDICYMQAGGDFGGLSSSYLFGQYETAGFDGEGNIVLTGNVYDWSAPDYNTETQTNDTPKGTYRIVLAPEGGPAVLGGYQFKEMTVNAA